MVRIKESDLNEASVKFAGEYVDQKFKGGSMIEKSLVITTIAHGYYMGARRCEEFANMGFLKRAYMRLTLKLRGSYFPLFPWLDTEWLGTEGMRGCDAYMRAKRLQNLPHGDVALIRGVLTLGFTKGFVYRETLH